jgi:hypothetical protein
MVSNTLIISLYAPNLTLIYFKRLVNKRLIPGAAPAEMQICPYFETQKRRTSKPKVNDEALLTPFPLPDLPLFLPGSSR